MSETNLPGGLQSDDPLWSASHTDYIARLRARRTELELEVNRLRKKLRKCQTDFKALRDALDYD